MVVSLEAIGIKSDKPLYNNRKQTINKQIDSVTPPEHIQHQTRNRKTRKISKKNNTIIKMSQRKRKVHICERNIYAETQNNEGEITIAPTGLKLNHSGKITERKRMRTDLFRRLGPPPPKKNNSGTREDLRARLGKKITDQGTKEVRQQVEPNTAKPKIPDETGTQGAIVGKVARRLITESGDDDDVNVETLTAGQVKEIYMNRYPEAGSGIYDVLITKATPPDDEHHIKMSLQMMKQRDESRDPILRENLLILSAYHLKVYHNLRSGRQ